MQPLLKWGRGPQFCNTTEQALPLFQGQVSTSHEAATLSSGQRSRKQARVTCALHLSAAYGQLPLCSPPYTAVPLAITTPPLPCLCKRILGAYTFATRLASPTQPLLKKQRQIKSQRKWEHLLGWAWASMPALASKAGCQMPTPLSQRHPDLQYCSPSTIHFLSSSSSTSFSPSF